MDINEMLKGVLCQECGKEHKCPIEKVYIENGAISHLASFAQSYNNVLIVADENTYSAAGDKTEAQLAGKIKGKVIFSGAQFVIPNEESIDAVYKKMDGVDLIVGIGSGVIQDLCKYVSHFKSVPYVVVATSPSMDGYASSGAAMILKGMKETVSAGLPLAIFADTEVLKNAPMEMIKAGYGDIIGKFSALNDWRLSTLINGEFFCKYIYDTTYEVTQKTLSLGEGLIKRDENSVGALMEALIVVGIMMSFLGNSRPASGSEHHLSHYFEITGIVKNRPYFAHGIDVAYSTVITAQIRENLLNKSFDAPLYREERGAYEQKIISLYGEAVGKGCIALQDKMGRYEENRAPLHKEKEAEIKKILRDMPTSEEIKNMLSLAELDFDEFYKLYGKETVENAVKYAKDLKDRYTVLWLNYDLGGN